jgi:hypothetical protein
MTTTASTTSTTSDNPEFLSPAQLAARFNIPVQSIYGWCMNHGPDSVPRLKMGKHTRFILADVLAWAKKRAQP